MRKIIAIFLILLLSVPYQLIGTEREKTLTILFTNDIHSAADNYSRLAYLLRKERAKAAASGSAVITVDAGDVSMGTEYHTLFESEAFDYLFLHKLGYDFYTFGNHDFDGGVYGLSKAMNHYIAAVNGADSYSSGSCCENRSSSSSDNFLYHYRTGKRDSISGGTLTFLSSNCDFHKTARWNSKVPKSGKFIKDYVFIERSGVKIAVVGIMGKDALVSTINGDSLLFADRTVRLRELLKKHVQESPDYIIVLSHGGSSWVDGKQITDESAADFLKRRRSEDGRIAANFGEIGAIISGHDHVPLHTPLIINNAVIGSTGYGLSYLGKMVFSGGKLVEYGLIPLSAVTDCDSSISNSIHLYSKRISDNFKAVYGISLRDTICTSDMVLSNFEDWHLGRLIAESYVNAAHNLLFSIDSSGDLSKFGTPDKLMEMVSIVPLGIIRKVIPAGFVTAGDLFRVLPLGCNINGHSGYPLLLMWVNGGELRNICEINASVASSTSDMRLFFGGDLTFCYNRFRIPFTRVFDLKIKGKPVKSDKLYPVVADIYTARLVGLLNSSSFGILSAEPKTVAGIPIKRFEDYILKINRKTELTGWFALTDFLKENYKSRLSLGDDRTYKMSEMCNKLQCNGYDRSNISPLFLYCSVIVLLAAVLLLFRKLRA